MKFGDGQRGKMDLTADRTLSVKNGASYGHDSRAAVDGGVELWAPLRHLLERSPKTLK